jgi:hypothetical protein
MKINYDEFTENNQPIFKRLRLLLNSKRLPRRRPRDPEEELVLRLMAYYRWQKELKEGNIIEETPRRYKIVK